MAAFETEELAVTSELGLPLPLNDFHAVSVSLPLWEHVVGYEEGNPEVISKMTCGYPRFRFHDAVQGLMAIVLACHTLQNSVSLESVYLTNKIVEQENEITLKTIPTTKSCLVFPSLAVGKRFLDFMVINAYPLFFFELSY
jgi:hypothetical protein